MGAYTSRNRAWVYIAFYDEYVGRHINTCAGLSLFFAVGLYAYGQGVNRYADTDAQHLLYNMQYFDKRSRLCHNMVMEHFEVHKEQLEDLVVDLAKVGPKLLTELPTEKQGLSPVTLDDFALIDELSGLNPYLENFLRSHDIPETVKQRIRSRMVVYSGDKPKEIAMQELRIKLYGDQR